jgi:hypothetical protein
VYFSGKSGSPTLMFTVIVDHHGRVRGVCGPHPGTRNGITAVEMNPVVAGLQRGTLLPEFQFRTRTQGGGSKQHTGAYLIADGGFLRWRVLQCPLKWCVAASKAAWSKFIESVRKDVECIFGRIKGRFRTLKIPSRFHKQARVGNQFKACCVGSPG